MGPKNRVKCQYCPQTFAQNGAALENHRVHKHWDALVRDYPDRYKADQEPVTAVAGEHVAAEQPADRPTIIIDGLSEYGRRTMNDLLDKMTQANRLTNTYKAAQTGADHLRKLAERLRQPPSVASDAAREAIAEELLLVAKALDVLYQEMRDIDLRKLQTKARRWDTVAKAVMDSISEEVKGD